MKERRRYSKREVRGKRKSWEVWGRWLVNLPPLFEHCNIDITTLLPTDGSGAHRPWLLARQNIGNNMHRTAGVPAGWEDVPYDLVPVNLAKSFSTPRFALS